MPQYDKHVVSNIYSVNKYMYIISALRPGSGRAVFSSGLPASTARRAVGMYVVFLLVCCLYESAVNTITL